MAVLLRRSPPRHYQRCWRLLFVWLALTCAVAEHGQALTTPLRMPPYHHAAAAIASSTAQQQRHGVGRGGGFAMSNDGNDPSKVCDWRTEPIADTLVDEDQQQRNTHESKHPPSFSLHTYTHHRDSLLTMHRARTRSRSCFYRQILAEVIERRPSLSPVNSLFTILVPSTICSTFGRRTGSDPTIRWSSRTSI
jgi:hypothetical protein